MPRHLTESLVALVASGVLIACATTNATMNAGANRAAIDSADKFVGTWKVDLRPTPAAPAYYQEFVVNAVNGKSFTGTFYGAPITQGRINTDWGALRFAFVTSDQSGPYNHSGVLRNNRIEGMTNATGRDFLAYWSAER